MKEVDMVNSVSLTVLLTMVGKSGRECSQSHFLL